MKFFGVVTVVGSLAVGKELWGNMNNRNSVGIVGLGYVALPLAVKFYKHKDSQDA